jgi:hypothetical protein
MIYTYQDIPVYIDTVEIDTSEDAKWGISDDALYATSVSINFDRSVEPKKAWGESGSYEYLHSGPMGGTIQINSFHGLPFASLQQRNYILNSGVAIVKIGSLDFSGAISSYSLNVNPWQAKTETWNIQFFSGGGTMEAGPAVSNVTLSPTTALQSTTNPAGQIQMGPTGNLPNIIADVKYTDTRNITTRYELGSTYPTWYTTSRVKKVDITSDNITGLVTWSGEEASIALSGESFNNISGAAQGERIGLGGVEFLNVSGYITSQSLSVSEQGLLEGSMTIEETLV